MQAHKFLLSDASGSNTIGDCQDSGGAKATYDLLDCIDLRSLVGGNEVDALNNLLIAQANAQTAVITFSLDMPMTA